MVISNDYSVISLGNEPKEVLGFDTDRELELALLPLMEVKVKANENNNKS